MRLCFSATTLFLCIAVLSIVPPASATCPAYTHKDTVFTGSLDTLGDGWFVYGKNGKNGLYKSDLKSFHEDTIPNTSTDQPSWADISDDGKWIVYLTWGTNNHSNIYMITPDGKGKTLIPSTVQLDRGAYPTMVRFYRGSPKGHEIAYQSGYGRIEATSYSAVDTTITVGTERTVVSFPVIDSTSVRSGYSWETAISTGEGLGVWKDQVFLESVIDYTQFSRPGYVTIPDSGNGIATDSNLYMYANQRDLDSTTWGCGSTMSHDGQYCASNAGFIGDSCVPCKNAIVNTYIMDHKGFYVNHFFRLGDPAIDIGTIPQAHGVSINWCPADYRFGLYNQFDFDHENFTNNSEYIALAQIGNGTNTKQALKGVWLVHWPTNTWTMLTPTDNPLGSTGTTYTHPAVFFNAYASVQNPSLSRAFVQTNGSVVKSATMIGRTLILAPGVRSAAIYSPNGRLLWQLHRDQATGTMRVALPASIHSTGCLITKFNYDK